MSALEGAAMILRGCSYLSRPRHGCARERGQDITSGLTYSAAKISLMVSLIAVTIHYASGHNPWVSLCMVLNSSRHSTGLSLYGPYL